MWTSFFFHKITAWQANRYPLLTSLPSLFCSCSFGFESFVPKRTCTVHCPQVPFWHLYLMGFPWSRAASSNLPLTGAISNVFDPCTTIILSKSGLISTDSLFSKTVLVGEFSTGALFPGMSEPTVKTRRYTKLILDCLKGANGSWALNS